MKIANLDGRPHLVGADGTTVTDVAALLGERFSTFDAVYERWDEFRQRVRSLDPASVDVESADRETVPSPPPARSRFGSPSPAPRQIIAVGLNYSEHATESGFAVPETLPPVFTKFASSLSGPETQVVLPVDGQTDWEVELVAVIGRGGRNIPEVEAWSRVAGLAVGQDLSERVSQLQGPAPQFSLGKSFAGFAPIGPWLVTPDEFADPDDVALGCAIDGEIVQEGRTRDLLFPVPALVARISAVIELFPGDVLFTGTPAGVGVGRKPQRFLRAGEVLTSWAEGIGELRQTFVDDRAVVEGGAA